MHGRFHDRQMPNVTKEFFQIDRVWDILYLTKSSPLFLPTKYVMILQHGPFSLQTMLEGPWLHKITFLTPMVRPLDESRGSSPLQGHGSWLMCEVSLRGGLHYGPWSRPGMTWVYTKEKMAEWPRRLRSSKKKFKPTLSTAMVQRVFRWDKQKRWSRKISKGPCHKLAILMIFWIF